VSDFDSPWKEALDLYFSDFVAFFWPHIHKDVDWSRGWESLDKELQQLAPEAEQGRRYVDKLLRVWRRDGAEAWVLIHVEVQTAPEADFPRRMFTYAYRIFDRYNRGVCSLAVLADDDPGWRPDHFQVELWGSSFGSRFLPAKLLDYAGHEAELEADANPFARVVLAHLKVLETRRDLPGRQAWKWRLVRGLYERGFSPDDVRKLLRLIDWLMDLPKNLDDQFWTDLQTFQQEKTMPFISLPERVAMRALLRSVIEDALRAKFGAEGATLMPAVANIHELDQLRALHVAIIKAASMDEVRRSPAAVPPPPLP
jgi:hypothetical protein